MRNELKINYLFLRLAKVLKQGPGAVCVMCIVYYKKNIFLEIIEIKMKIITSIIVNSLLDTSLKNYIIFAKS